MQKDAMNARRYEQAKESLALLGYDVVLCGDFFLVRRPGHEQKAFTFGELEVVVETLKQCKTTPVRVSLEESSSITFSPEKPMVPFRRLHTPVVVHTPDFLEKIMGAVGLK